MKNIEYKNDMKRSLWKLLLCQTIVYGILWYMMYPAKYDTITITFHNSLFITFYSICVLVTVIIPMIKGYKNK